MTGLCLIMGWLPSQAEKEDWATLWALQQRIKEEQKEAEYESWRNKIRNTWRRK